MHIVGIRFHGGNVFLEWNNSKEKLETSGVVEVTFFSY